MTEATMNLIFSMTGAIAIPVFIAFAAQYVVNIIRQHKDE